ncbi:hypothetical protein PCYB_006500 [Plasmodium cynomolgi strain B]|uniref:CYIR protein n=1 Tax=Plasmodium cynomolgi (strain B) TaxID=1120755 RepID=K6UFD3_PLACD|nr:hypothetical protein PCYB_006500 [Plasmodium cynomolgi strain B]GAB69901.1 hypothetical protein PCYB_006500 [Plasmodium cynomolgi strain B]
MAPTAPTAPTAPGVKYFNIHFCVLQNIFLNSNVLFFIKQNISSETDLLYLPTQLFYSYINFEHNDLSIYNERCDSIKLDTINLKNHGDEVKKYCKKILRHLEKNDRIWFISVPENDVCILLNYWVYSELANILGSDKSSTILPALGQYQRLWNDIVDKLSDNSLNNKCKPDFYIYKQEDWKERKELYEYYVDYTNLNTLALKDDDKCTYYKKIKEKQELFDYFDSLCASDRGKCPQIYNDCRSYNPKYVLHKFLKCHAEMEKQKAPAETLAHSAGTHETVVGISGLQAAAEMSQHAQSTSESSDIRTKVTHSILGGAQALMAGTMLYRVCIYFVSIYHYSTNL